MALRNRELHARNDDDDESLQHLRKEMNINTGVLAKQYLPYGVGKFWTWDPQGGTATKTGEYLSETDVYHHGKFHADRCHRQWDICKHTKNYLVPCHTNYGW